MELLGYLGMLFVGVSLGLIGGGGALLTVPIMVYLFSIPTLLATSYSLFIVGIASLFGAWRFYQLKQVEYRTAAIFTVPALFGTYLARRIVIPALPDVVMHVGSYDLTKERLILGSFALVTIAASGAMIRKSSFVQSKGLQQHSLFLTVFLGALVGFISGFVGAGGGFLIIPTLVIIGNMPMPLAIGTSLMIIAINSLIGFSGDFLAGHQHIWSFLLRTTAVALFGIFAGTALSRKIPAAKLKALFGWFVLAVGSSILIHQLLQA